MKTVRLSWGQGLSAPKQNPQMMEFKLIVDEFLTTSNCSRGPRNYFDVRNFLHFHGEIAHYQLFKNAFKKRLQKGHNCKKCTIAKSVCKQKEIANTVIAKKKIAKKELQKAVA